jgi:alkylhydroperoxidase family enzyme
MSETGPRVPMLAPDAAKAAAAKVGLTERLAGLSVFRVLLHDPELARDLATTLQRLLAADSPLDARLRELAIMRIGWRTGSMYEWTQHWRVARRLDIPEADVLAVRDWRSAANLSAADKAVVAAVDETLETGMISDATWSACGEHLRTPQERIQLVIAIGNWTMFSQLLKSLRIPLEEGVMAWPPDGKAAPERKLTGA